MRKKKWTVWLLCMSMAVIMCGCKSSSFHNPSRGETLIMAANAYTEPYVYYAGDQVIGIDVEIAQAIAEKLGMELEIRDMELDAVFEALNAGKAHIGMAGLAVTQERQENVDFSDPYMRIKQAVVVRSDSEAVGIGDLKEGIIGVPKGAAGEIAASELPDAMIRTCENGADALQALLNDTMDAVLLDPEAAKELTAGTEGARILEEEFVTRGCSVAVAKGNEELLDDIDKALDAIIADGTVFEITNKYVTEK